eukprot:gene6334-4561_t
MCVRLQLYCTYCTHWVILYTVLSFFLANWRRVHSLSVTASIFFSLLTIYPTHPSPLFSMFYHCGGVISDYNFIIIIIIIFLFVSFFDGSFSSPAGAEGNELRKTWDPPRRPALPLGCTTRKKKQKKKRIHLRCRNRQIEEKNNNNNTSDRHALKGHRRTPSAIPARAKSNSYDDDEEEGSNKQRQQ